MLRFVEAAQVKQLLELLLVLLLRLLVVMLGLLMVGLERGQCLHVLDVLLEDQHVVRVFLAGHVYPQVTSDVRLVVADVAAKRRLRLPLATGLAGDVRTVVLLVMGASRWHRRVLRRRRIARCRATAATLLELLHVIQMFVALHVNAEITLRRGGVVAHFASVRLVAAGVRLAAG